MRARRRHERQRREELEGIAAFGDVNELTISGHVEHQPTLGTDEDGLSVCEFVLTHTTMRWGELEPQHYKVATCLGISEHYAANWQPDQAIIVNGWLEHHIIDTLAGPIPGASIIAHTIAILGAHPHQLTATHQEQDG